MSMRQFKIAILKSSQPGHQSYLASEKVLKMIDKLYKKNKRSIKKLIYEIFNYNTEEKLNGVTPLSLVNKCFKKLFPDTFDDHNLEFSKCKNTEFYGTPVPAGFP